MEQADKTGAAGDITRGDFIKKAAIAAAGFYIV
jgi:hypothetical protein